jgi:hypothetical protein
MCERERERIKTCQIHEMTKIVYWITVFFLEQTAKIIYNLINF